MASSCPVGLSEREQTPKIRDRASRLNGRRGGTGAEGVRAYFAAPVPFRYVSNQRIVCPV